MKRITKGNDFTLRIPVMKMVRGERVPFPIPACTDVQVRVCDSYKRMELAYEVDVESDNILLARVEGDKIAVGTYAVEVRGKILGNDWRSEEYPQFEIVARNADADLDLGESDDGDDSVEMDTALVVLPPSVELKDAIDRCDTIAAQAEKVNARLDGNILTVTNREGDEKSVNLTDTDEHVIVSGIIEGGATNLIDGKTLKVHILDEEENEVESFICTFYGYEPVEFTVKKGQMYLIEFPEVQGANPICPIRRVASSGTRFLDVEYTMMQSEAVTVKIMKVDASGATKPLENLNVYVSTSDIGEWISTTYKTDVEGKVEFNVAIGSYYTVSIDKQDGMCVRYNQYSFGRIAKADSYRYDFLYGPFDTGIWLIDDENNRYTYDEWTESGKDAQKLMFVCIKTLATQRFNGDIYIGLDALKECVDRKKTRQWCSQDVLFENIPESGIDSNSSTWSEFAYNGLHATETIMAEGDSRGLSTPACDYAHSFKVENGGTTYQGYLPTVYQWRIAWNNIGLILDVLGLKFPDMIFTVSAFLDNKWTSTQFGDKYSAVFTDFSIALDSAQKKLSAWVIPFFACLPAS